MIRATLIGSTTCVADGITATSNAPVLMLCRKLVNAGRDPSTPMEVYRGDTLALKVRSIGEAAKLKVAEDRAPRFKAWEPPSRLRDSKNAAASDQD
jgi:hypothetical protein